MERSSHIPLRSVKKNPTTTDRLCTIICNPVPRSLLYTAQPKDIRYYLWGRGCLSLYDGSYKGSPGNARFKMRDAEGPNLG